MVKKLLILILLIVAVAIGWVGNRWFTEPTLIAPLPYQIDAKFGTDLDLAQEANVLILGDRLGKSLDPYIKDLVEKLSVKLKDPMRIVNWSRTHENLGRSLHKLKQLKKFPDIILYLGGSEEFYEERFHIQDRKKILENIKMFKDENKSSLIYTFPPLSRFIYHPVKRYQLSADPLKDPGDFTSKYQQMKMEITFKLFDVELEELISLVKEKGSYLVLSTAPINLELKPKKVCLNSTTDSLEQYQRELESKLDKGMHKAALSEIRKLSETSIGNAKTFFLLGRAQLGSGLYEQAQISLKKAASFDCGNTRSHPVFNAIIKKKVSGKGIKLIDFNNIVTRHLGLNELFLAEHFPQEIYYRHYIEELYVTIKEKFKL